MRFRWPGLAVFVLVSLFAGLPAQASAAKLYQWKLEGAMHMEWLWPANPNNDGKRDQQEVDVFGGKGCGTAPNHARWKIKFRSAKELPKQTLIIDFVFLDTPNPAKLIDARYSGEPQADVQVYLKFSGKKNPRVKLIGKPTGDVVGLDIGPGKTGLSKKRVQSCSI